jgi:hypothetical protein
MAKTVSAELQLASFIAKFTPEVAALTEAILVKMRRRYPHAVEIVYDNYNALAIGFGPGERTSDAIFSIAVFPRWASLFFLQAKGLSDPTGLLKGSGKVAKHVVLKTLDVLDEPAVIALMEQAAETAKVPFPGVGAHRLVIKSIAAKQRPRRPVEG